MKRLLKKIRWGFSSPADEYRPRVKHNHKTLDVYELALVYQREKQQVVDYDFKALEQLTPLPAYEIEKPDREIDQLAPFRKIKQQTPIPAKRIKGGGS